MSKRKVISIFTPCYNEEENVELLIEAVKKEMNVFPNYQYEHVFIDNASTDRTVEILKSMAKIDSNIKVIINNKNFGQIRSPFHGFIQCQGDAVITLVADFQDPPEMIEKFIKKWEEGFKIVIGVKNKSKESKIMFAIRKFFYNLLSKVSEGDSPVKNFTGFGLFDKQFVQILRELDDPMPYFRGLVTDFGFDRHEIEYLQPKRRAGKTKNNFFTLYELAMLGFTNHSKLPLRLSAFIGFFASLLSLFVAFGYLIYKLLYWDTFQAGTAPMVIGIFFFSSVQLFFIGIIGEYIGAIHTQVRKRPLVIEKERINFD